MSHVSIRVPWHDNFWSGCFCLKPSCNTYCKVLPSIAMEKNDDEDKFAGKAWHVIPASQWPACAGENGGFMSPDGFTKIFVHNYAKNRNLPHAKLLPTPIDIPPYTAVGVPFRYMSKNFEVDMNKKHPEFHADENAPFTSSWIYGSKRQRDVLSWFRSGIKANESLCVFYCKNGNPVDDDGSRMVVGIGDVTRMLPMVDYNSAADFSYPLWEIIFEHSIRGDLKESRGFLLPYQQYLGFDEEYIKKRTGLTKQQALDEIKLTLDKVNNDQKIYRELSYACDYVSNQSMLVLLEAARNSVDAVMRHKLVGGDWERQYRWINESIKKVKSQISPFPAFAEALKALGFDYAYMIEQDLRKAGCGHKDDPWVWLDRLFYDDLSLPEYHYKKDLPLYKQTWTYLTQSTKDVLHLLSRFEIDADWIKYYLDRHDKHVEILANPYLISEESLQTHNFLVTTRTIDTGVIIDPDIQGECLPQAPSVVESVLDPRRLRSMTIERLCMALDEGDTLMSIAELEQYLKDTLKNDKNAALPAGILTTLRPLFSAAICYIPDDEPKALQLKEYFGMEEKLRNILNKRARKSVKHPIHEDWLAIARSDENYDPEIKESVDATQQQAEALMMMAGKRLSVLTGGAGTGKTTVVRSFLSSQSILNEGVLLLAPTGKARVRLGSMALKRGVQAQTIAQFLYRHKRYNGDRMMAMSNPEAKKFDGARNIIIDECSMITTRDFYVLFEALDMSVINRVILIGDPYQLPPIGAGRPFSDLCHYLLDDENKDKPEGAIYKLKTVVRTISTGRESDVLTFASWFSGNKPQKYADAIFDKIEQHKLDHDLQVAYWNDEDDLNEKLHEALCSQLGCNPDELSSVIKSKIGTDNLAQLAQHPEKLENLQILSPVLNPVWGTRQLNDCMQQWPGNNAGNNYMQFATQKIFSTDKVIQLRNETKDGYPSRNRYALANGQIGFVYDIKKNYNSAFANITFVGIPGQTFGYTATKGEDADTSIELSYAITIHKSQGSDFETVIVVLPKTGRILSRELIYTALTRARKKVILLVQDNINWLRQYTKPQASVLASRNSNLFGYSVREQKAQIPFVEGLIHRTKPDKNGDVHFVRSKSEVIIANELISAGLKFEYEKLIEENGHRCIPDFTFVSDYGDTIIWEHLGMLGVPEYKASWIRKHEFYKSLGFVDNETLFTTEDHPDGSIFTTEVLDVINNLKNIL